MVRSSLNAVWVHDIFNICALSIITGIDILYVYLSTEYSKIGTSAIGEDQKGLFKIFFILFSCYLTVDTVWLLVVNNCTITSKGPIVIHHILTGCYLMIPYLDGQFAWHFGVTLLVEFNTLLLTMKLNVAKDSSLYMILNTLFYISWLGLRVIGFPILVIFYCKEYSRYTLEVGYWYNMVIWAPIFQLMITALSYKWTYDMIKKT
jgi:hypothetical protein